MSSTDEPAESAAAPATTPQQVTLAPPTFAELLKLCTKKERRFITEYLRDENGKAAVVRSGCFRYCQPDVKAVRLQKRPRVENAIEAGRREVMAAALERAVVTREEVVKRLALIAMADPRELCEVRIDCCRYCWGAGHRYQETAPEREQRHAEWQRRTAEEQGKSDPKPPGPFDELGGIGFHPMRSPNPSCPGCFGRGERVEIYHDSRGYTAAASALYAGVKRTRDGIEIKMQSQERALEILTRYVGGFSEKHELTGKDGATLPAPGPVYMISREEAKQIARDLDDKV